MPDTTNLVGSKGININVGIDTTDIIYISCGIFFAVVLGGVIVKLLTKKI